MAKTYPGADSDHNLLVAEFRVQWKKLKVKQSTITYDRRKINKLEVKTQATNLISNALLDVKNSSEVEKKIEKIVKVTTTIKKEILIANIDKRKPWMNEEILKLMEERRNK